MSNYLEQTTEDVLKVWNTATIPTIQAKTAKDRIKTCYINGMKIGDIPVSKRREALRQTKLRWLNELFDIASCRCINSDLCKCPRIIKVPDREWSFLIDQRGARKMFLGGIDSAVTRKMQTKEKSTLQHQFE